MQSLARRGMRDGEAVGMQAETVALCAVESIADDGAGEAFRVSTMNAELVCASCLGPEVNEVFACKAIARDGAAAVFAAHHLTRTVVGIGTKRKVDNAFWLLLRLVAGRLL